MSVDKFTQGMICGAAVMSAGNIDDLLGSCGKIDWRCIEKSDIDILITEHGIEVLRKFGYQS